MRMSACHAIDAVIHRGCIPVVGSSDAIDVGRLSGDRDVDVGDGSEVGLMSHGIHIGISSGGTVDVPMIADWIAETIDLDHSLGHHQLIASIIADAVIEAKQGEDAVRRNVVDEEENPAVELAEAAEAGDPEENAENA